MDLTSNPFHVLRVSARAGRESVVKAFEAGVSRGKEEAELNRARHALLTPRARIDAEVGWLAGIAPRQAAGMVDALAAGDFSNMAIALSALKGLDKANLAADLCHRAGHTEPALNALIESYSEFSPSSVRQSLEALHLASKFPAPDRGMVEDALERLRMAHARAALTYLTGQAVPGVRLAGLIESAWDDANAVEPLLAALVNLYDGWAEPTLGRIRREVDSVIAAHQAAPAEVPVAKISALLDEWDCVSQPLQLFEARRGREERRSRDLYVAVRQFSIWLANERGQYQAALQIARALLRVFPELPAVAEQLEADVEALEELVSVAEFKDRLLPLGTAIQDAEQQVGQLMSELALSGFGPGSSGLALRVYEGFAEAVLRTSESAHRHGPWTMLRDLSLKLNNEHDSPEAALAITAWLAANSPGTVADGLSEQFQTDLRELQQRVKWVELRSTPLTSARAEVLAVELLQHCDDEERELLEKFLATVRAKRAGRRRQVLWWTGAAVVAGWFILTADGTSPQAAKNIEEMPSLGKTGALTQGETNYCAFQSFRLDVARTAVSSRAKSLRFDALIADYNARCARAQVYSDYWEAAQAMVAERKIRLHQQGVALLD